MVIYVARAILPTEAVTVVMHIRQGYDITVTLLLSDTALSVIGIIGFMLPGVENDADAPVLVQNGNSFLRNDITRIAFICRLAAIEVARCRFVKRIFALIDCLNLRIARSFGLGKYGAFSAIGIFFISVVQRRLPS